MKNTRQIELINQKLNDEKSKFMKELSRINSLITQRIDSFKKMNSYLNEYLDENKLALTKSTPGLSKNIHMFVSRINDVILHSENELTILNSSKNSLVEKITVLDKKIDLMKTLENNIVQEAIRVDDKKYQAMMDDLISVQLSRDNHE